MNYFTIVVVFSLFFVTQAQAQVCGNGLCDNGETIASCPNDCTGTGCNTNGLCEVGEDSMNCQSDCIDSGCNSNGICEPGESLENCLADCESLVCNRNGICEAPAENSQNCLSDCSGLEFCGNLECDSGETAILCPSDCSSSQVCGNGICEGTESSTNCPEDCTVDTSVCGDGICEGTENPENCPGDCSSCGDGTCQAPENALSCPLDCPSEEFTCGNGICEGEETYFSCPNDCPDMCGNGGCDLGETTENCPQDCVPITTGTTGPLPTTGTTGPRPSTTGTTGVAPITTGTTGVVPTTTGGATTTGGTTTGGTGCMPQCDGKVCGDDQCGGLCGDCAPGSFCQMEGSLCVVGLMVQGKVVDSRNGFVIFEAECTLMNDWEEPMTAVSDDRGEYSYTEVKPADYMLTCSHPDYFASSVHVSLVPSAQTVYLPTLRLAVNPCTTTPPCSGAGSCADGMTCDCEEGLGGLDCSASLLDEVCTPYKGFSEQQTNSILIKSALNKAIAKLEYLRSEMQEILEVLPEYMTNSCCYDQEVNSQKNGTQKLMYPIDLRYISATSHMFMETLSAYNQDNSDFYDSVSME